jgi:hypothetical protein
MSSLISSTNNLFKFFSVNAAHYGHLAPGVGVHVGIANGPSGHPPAHDKAVVQRRPGACGGIGRNTVEKLNN